MELSPDSLIPPPYRRGAGFSTRTTWWGIAWKTCWSCLRQTRSSPQKKTRAAQPLRRLAVGTVCDFGPQQRLILVEGCLPSTLPYPECAEEIELGCAYHDA